MLNIKLLAIFMRRLATVSKYDNISYVMRRGLFPIYVRTLTNLTEGIVVVLSSFSETPG
jgi:hypothetical protein